MTTAQSLCEGLQGVINGLDGVDTKRTKVLLEEGTPGDQGFRIRLDGHRGARLEIQAYGQKIIALLTAEVQYALQGIILAIRAWCMREGLPQLAT